MVADGRITPPPQPLQLLFCPTHLVVAFKEELGDEADGAAREHLQDVGRKHVAVAVEEALRVVRHASCIVVDGKTGLARPGRHVVAVTVELGRVLLDQCLVGGLWETAFLVQQGEDADGPGKAQVQQRLVVYKGDVAAVDALTLVLFQLVLEDLAGVGG